MHFDSLSLCAISALVVSCVLSVGNCLECYHCNFTVPSTNKDDLCQGRAALQKCQDPAVCLTAKYSYHDSPMPATTTTFKTCYADLGGNECQIFLQNIRNMNSAAAKIDFSESCGTCSENGCNHKPDESSKPGMTAKKSTAANVSASFLLISLFLLPVAKLL